MASPPLLSTNIALLHTSPSGLIFIQKFLFFFTFHLLPQNTFLVVAWLTPTHPTHPCPPLYDHSLSPDQSLFSSKHLMSHMHWTPHCSRANHILSSFCSCAQPLAPGGRPSPLSQYRSSRVLIILQGTSQIPITFPCPKCLCSFLPFNFQGEVYTSL